MIQSFSGAKGEAIFSSSQGQQKKKEILLHKVKKRLSSSSISNFLFVNLQELRRKGDYSSFISMAFRYCYILLTLTANHSFYQNHIISVLVLLFLPDLIWLSTSQIVSRGWNPFILHKIYSSARYYQSQSQFKRPHYLNSRFISLHGKLQIKIPEIQMFPDQTV